MRRKLLVRRCTVKELDNELNKRIGARIREVRIQQKMSQADLADKAHISLPHVSELELGKKGMKLSTFIQIAEALQTSTDRLLRPDIPEVNGIYQNEFSELLSDCTPTEIESIIRIIKELKISMHSKKDNYEY